MARWLPLDRARRLLVAGLPLGSPLGDREDPGEEGEGDDDEEGLVPSTLVGEEHRARLRPAGQVSKAARL
jgi:hypothetical protein